MLSGLTILDFTHRLPGPLAGKILGDLGAHVIKIEDEKHKDPFLSGMFSDVDPSFKDWYQQLNEKKQIIRLDFKSPEIKSQIHGYLEKSNGVLLSLSPKLRQNLGLTDVDLIGLKRPIAVVELEASSTHNKSMHDLNALALSGLLSLHVAGKSDAVIAPPFLPIAGIAFGQQVATQMLANVIASHRSHGIEKTTCYLHDTAESIFTPFWSKNLRDQKQTKFLHNGAYPCYSLYKTADDQYVAVAAVEEKFWQDLSETFGITLPLEKRFDTSEESFRIVSRVFAKLTASEIESKGTNKELCISIVRKVP